MTRWAFPGIYEVHLVAPVLSTRAPHHPSTPMQLISHQNFSRGLVASREGRAGGIVVVLFCEKLPHLVIGNIPFQKGNE